jgi:hypothetical protein
LSKSVSGISPEMRRSDSLDLGCRPGRFQPDTQRLTPLNITELASVFMGCDDRCVNKAGRFRQSSKGRRYREKPNFRDQLLGAEMQTVLNAGSPDREGRPTRLVALGIMPSGRHLDLGTVIEIVANSIHVIERGIAERPVMKETLAASYPSDEIDKHRQSAASLPDLMAQTGSVTAVLVPLKTVARWRARHDTQFQLEIERGVQVVVCDRHAFEDTLVSLVRSAEKAMGEAAQLLVNVEREDGVGQGLHWDTLPDLHFHGSGVGIDAVAASYGLASLLAAIHRDGPGVALAMEFDLSSNHASTDAILFGAEAVITMRLRRIWASVGASAPLFPAGRRRRPSSHLMGAEAVTLR